MTEESSGELVDRLLRDLGEHTDQIKARRTKLEELEAKVARVERMQAKDRGQEKILPAMEWLRDKIANGTVTVEDVKNAQYAAGLVADGLIGPMTKRALGLPTTMQGGHVLTVEGIRAAYISAGSITSERLTTGRVDLDYRSSATVSRTWLRSSHRIIKYVRGGNDYRYYIEGPGSDSHWFTDFDQAELWISDHQNAAASGPHDHYGSYDTWLSYNAKRNEMKLRAEQRAYRDRMVAEKAYWEAQDKLRKEAEEQKAAASKAAAEALAAEQERARIASSVYVVQKARWGWWIRIPRGRFRGGLWWRRLEADAHEVGRRKLLRFFEREQEAERVARVTTHGLGSPTITIYEAETQEIDSPELRAKRAHVAYDMQQWEDEFNAAQKMIHDGSNVIVLPYEAYKRGTGPRALPPGTVTAADPKPTYTVQVHQAPDIKPEEMAKELQAKMDYIEKMSR